MKIPTPREIGLPDKFDKWRPGQEDAIERIIVNPKRVSGILQPTGSGKSAVIVGAALLSKEPTCVVTYSKALQSQYMNDFESIGMVDIRGRSNYACELRNDYTCEDGYNARCPYKGSVVCPSSLAEIKAAGSSLVVTNYAKWIASRKYGTGMSHFKRVVFDEGHLAFNALASAMHVDITASEMEKKLKMDMPHEDIHLFSTWKQWSQVARVVAENEMNLALARITGVSQPKVTWIRHYSHMRNLTRRLQILATAPVDSWIVDETFEGFSFDPIRPGRYSEGNLLLHIPKITIISATLRPKSMFMIGIGGVDFQFTEYPSDFDPKRCPIYYVPRMRVDKNHPDLSALWVLFDQIAARRKDRNALVHPTSYDRGLELYNTSRFAPNMHLHRRGESAEVVIQKFMKEYPGAILVSPVIGAGYDFKFKAAEWQFLCKIPFPDSRSKIVKARQDDDKEFGPYVAMQDLVQECGRIMRDKKDQGETFIGDMHLDWFLPRYGHLAPKNFHGFFKTVSSVPAPPERLQ